METKATLRSDGCFARALPGEPMFTLLGRDRCAPEVIRFWADQRAQLGIDSENSECPENIADALETADAFEKWREENDGAWRGQPATMPHLVPVPADSTATLAGRILGGGDPLENEELLGKLEQHMADQGIIRIARDDDPIGETRRRLVGALQEVFGAYFEAARSLAGFVLEADPAEGPNRG